MKIAYLDCISGISGDMTLGALVDAGIPLDEIQAGIDSLGLPSCRLVASEVTKKGMRATSISVEHEPEHAHRHLHHITQMIDGSSLTTSQKDLAVRIFTRLGEAEAKVHGTTIEKVHFHEVGAVDSIADIVGSAIGWDLLAVDRIECSPVPTGGGSIEIAHGRVSIPAPATAELLKGIPLANSEVQAELTTPTGAAIIATIVDQFGNLPSMVIDSIGLGAGERDLESQANVLRLLVGQSADPVSTEEVWVLETNLDDSSGELVGHCCTLLAAAGALDVYTSSIQMKKNRPGVTLSVLCQAHQVAELEQILFRETTTLGVRRWSAHRTTASRQSLDVVTPWGPVTGKLATLPDGTLRFTPEYESCRAVSEEHSIPLPQVYQQVQESYRASAVDE